MSSQSSSRSSSSRRSTVSSSSDTSSSSSSRQEDGSHKNGEPEGRQSSERSSSGTPSLITPTVSSATTLAHENAPGRAPAQGAPPFHAAVGHVMDLLQTTLASQGELPKVASVKAEDPALAHDEELQRIPSLQTLLKLQDGDLDDLLGRPRRPSDGDPLGEESEGSFSWKHKKRSSGPSHFRDRHGRVRHNWNTVRIETLSLGMRNDKTKPESELEKSWGDIAGKLAFVHTRLDQVVPMSASRLLNEALDPFGTERRMSVNTKQKMEGMAQSRIDVRGMLQALSRSDPMKPLKEAANVAIVTRLEEFAACEKDIVVRERHVDTPEMVQLGLQRWSVQQGFCLSNIAERRELARALCVARRSNTRRGRRRMNNAAARRKAMEDMMTSKVSHMMTSQTSHTQSKAQDEDGNPRAKDKEVLRDLTTERGVLLEIKREMTKLKRKRRVLEDQWVDQPRILLTRLENQSRSLRLKVEAKMHELEVGRQRLADANRRWQSNRTLTEPTLVDLEIQAYDIRRELAVSVLRWVRKDRSEALKEWRTQMAKYHQDKTRMAGNFAEAVRHWREDANFALPGPSGINPWKASLAFTPQAVQEGDPEEDEQLSSRRVQIHQGLTLAGITRNQLVNQERMLDNRKRPLGNCWELLRRQYITYRSILEAQLQHWLRGDFVGPCLRRVRDLTGAFQTSLAEVVKELEAVRSGAREDSKVPDIEAKRREGDRRQRTGKDRSELKMEEAIQNILLHLEKEMSLLANITAPRGELSELLRTQQHLSNIAAARPFSLDDLTGNAPPQVTPNGRKLSKSAAAGAEEEPLQVTYLVVQEGLEAPVRAARQLARLLGISWSTYLGKWEGLIRRYQDARSAYLEFQQKCAETARQKLLRDLRERPYLFEDLLKKSNAKWRQVEDTFRRTYTQPVYDRYKVLANAVADLSTELLQLKKQTHSLQQDPSLSFAASLQEETNEELLARYQQELDAESQRNQELDRQIAAQKELERVILEQQLKPTLTTVAQASRLLQDLGGPEAKEARSSLVVERVVQAEQLVEVLALADRALRGRGYQAGLEPRKLLQFVETLLWPNASWKDPEEEARRQAARKSRKVSIMSVASSRSNRSQRAKKEKEVTVPISALRRKSEQPAERPKGQGLSDVPSIQLPEPGKETWQVPSIQLPEPGQEVELAPSIPLPGPNQGSDLTISDLPSMPLTGPDQVEENPSEQSSSVDAPHARQGRRTSTVASEFDADSVASEPLDPDRMLTGPPLPPAPALEPPAQELSRPPLPSSGCSSPSTSPSPTLNQAAAAGVLQPLEPAEDDAEAVPEETRPPEPRDLPGFDFGQEGPEVPEYSDGPEVPEHSDEVSVPADELPDELLPLDPLQDEGLTSGDHPEAEAASTALLDDTGQLNEVQQEETPPLSRSQEESSKTEEVSLEGPEATQQSLETESFVEEASGMDVPLPDEAAPGEPENQGEPETEDIPPEALPSADEEKEPAVSESRSVSTPSKDLKVRIAFSPQEVMEREISQEEEGPIEEDPGSTEVQVEDPAKPAGMLFQVFSHSEPPGVGFLAPPPKGPPKLRWKDWLKGEEAAQSYSNPVLQRMQEVRAALLGSSGVSRPAQASRSLRSWVKQRSRLAGVAAAELPKGGLSVGDLQPNAFKALDRRPTRRSPPWMAADRSRQGSPVSPVPAVDELSIKPQQQRLLITSDSLGRLGRLQTPTQITLDFDDEFLRAPSPPPGPCRTLGGGFKAPAQSRPGSRKEGMLPSLGDRAEQQPTAGREGLAVRSSHDKRECRPTSSPGPMAELWGHARPKGQWKVLLSTGRDSPDKAREIHTGELRELMSARGFQVKTPDLAEASPVRAKAPSPIRPPLATQDLAEFLHVVKHGPGSPSKAKPKRRRRPISNAKGTRLRAARMPPDPDVSLEPFLATVRQSAPTPA